MFGFVSQAALAAAMLTGCVNAAPAKPDFSDAGTGGTNTGGASSSTGGSPGSGTGGASSSTGGSVGSGGGAATGGRGVGGVPGTGGTSTAGTGGQPGGVVAVDPCAAADVGNDDREHATAYPVYSAEFRACHQSGTDIDFYQFTTPSTPAGGGVLMVSAIDVGTNGNIELTAFSATDNGEITSAVAPGGGASAYLWFGATAATTYRVSVARYSTNGTVANPYTFKTAFLPVNDTHEVNDLRTQASALTVGAATQGYIFAGYTASTGYPANAWDDWYKVTLGAGSATFTLEILASDNNAELTLYNSLGASIADMVSPTAGSGVALTRTGITAGDYYIVVSPYSTPTAKGPGSVPPQYSQQPYTLTVTQ